MVLILKQSSSIPQALWMVIGSKTDPQNKGKRERGSGYDVMHIVGMSFIYSTIEFI